jgi:endogenous inhibitor of DNA gyrase (YacG/DUF329 family)
MIRGTCPLCRKPWQVDAPADLPSFPFCSDRCRLIDLGRWLDESYALPDRAIGTDDDAEPPTPAVEDEV